MDTIFGLPNPNGKREGRSTQADIVMSGLSDRKAGSPEEIRKYNGFLSRMIAAFRMIGLMPSTVSQFPYLSSFKVRTDQLKILSIISKKFLIKIKHRHQHYNPNYFPRFEQIL